MAMLKKGVNITGWFRFPGSLDPDRLAAWMPDSAIDGLRDAGFTFVRLAVDPAVLADARIRTVAADAVCRLQRRGLAVVVGPHPHNWHLETDSPDRDRLRAFWREFSLALRTCDPARVFPETLNEPVFPNAAPAWRALQHDLWRTIRSALPTSTIVLTGHDWGSIAGLEALQPEPDPNVVYSFHFYDPVDLTSLAGYRHDVDRSALTRLPFPASDSCHSVAASAPAGATRDLMSYYCALGWDESRLAARIQAAADWASRHDAALLAGEFGATARLNKNTRLAWLSTVRRSLESRSIGWAIWGYDDEMGFAVSRPPPAKPILDRDVLSALGLKIQ